MNSFASKSKLIAKLTEEIYDNLKIWNEISIALDKPEYEKLLDDYCPYDNRDKITRYSWLLGQIRGAYPNLNLTISIDGQDAHGPHIVWLNGKKF
jgi:hypothetical protein